MISALQIVKIDETDENFFGEVIHTHQIEPEISQNRAFIDTLKFNLEVRAAAIHKLSSKQYFIREVEAI